MLHSKSQIVATIGPASEQPTIIKAMIEHQLDVVRLNFSWSDVETHIKHIDVVRRLEAEYGRHIPIIQDIPGPRVQKGDEHTYDHRAESSLTSQDEAFIQFGVEHELDYIALSFVGGPEDVKKGKSLVNACLEHFSGQQRRIPKIIAKIERAVALDYLDEIIAVADAVMVARGDLGNEIALERIPFVQADIIRKCKKSGKPVITATQMLLSMVEHPTPTRAEVTDVAAAILLGSDAVMLSDETARGQYPVEAVAMMEKIVLEAERHMQKSVQFNYL